MEAILFYNIYVDVDRNAFIYHYMIAIVNEVNLVCR